MDIIQRTVSVFTSMLQRVKDIGNLILSNGLSAIDDTKESRRLFWIFNW